MNDGMKKPLYQVIDGIRIPAKFSPKCFREALNYQPGTNDVFIVTYPKCGTTWMQNIAMYIFRKGQPIDSVQEFLEISPFIDMFGIQSIERMPRPGAFKTHIPLNRLPFSTNAKYIIVVRNPKDCCVSLYHHTIGSRGFNYEDGTFDDFFELFMVGEVEYDDYFDHLLSWYPRRNEPNIFHTTYEAMKKDTEDIVLRLARFLGDEYADILEKDNCALKNVLHFSSFSYMKENLRSIFSFDAEKRHVFEGANHIADFIRNLDLPESQPNFDLVRKGEVGDWKNYFSQDQSLRLEKKFVEKSEQADIASLWTP